MKIHLPLLAALTFLLTFSHGYAQPDSARIGARALFFADSLIKTDAYKNWSIYADLVPPSVIKYYGGKDGYIEHIKTGNSRTRSGIDEEYPERSIQTLMRSSEQWQCVIRVSRYFHKDHKKFHFVTYFVGQSLDEGETWRMFDVSYNAIANIIYLLPDVLGDLPIQEPSLLSEEEELARQKAALAAAAAAQAPKKTSSKKK